MPPPPPPVPNGPMVAPLMRAYRPPVVVHRSPLTGEVGAVPCGRVIEAAAVVVAGKVCLAVQVLATPSIGKVSVTPERTMRRSPDPSRHMSPEVVDAAAPDGM